MSAQVWIAIFVGLAAVADDLARRQISNWIPVAALSGGLGWQIGQSGWAGLGYALGGTAVGLAVFLAFYLLGGMGGGDIKLMAGFGALLGAGALLEAAFWTAVIGGVMAAAVLGFRAVRQRALGRGSAKPARTELSEEAKQHEASIPYAPAIALGVWMSLLSRA